MCLRNWQQCGRQLHCVDSIISIAWLKNFVFIGEKKNHRKLMKPKSLRSSRSNNRRIHKQQQQQQPQHQLRLTSSEKNDAWYRMTQQHSFRHTIFRCNNKQKTNGKNHIQFFRHSFALHSPPMERASVHKNIMWKERSQETCVIVNFQFCIIVLPFLLCVLESVSESNSQRTKKTVQTSETNAANDRQHWNKFEQKANDIRPLCLRLIERRTSDETIAFRFSD